MAKRYMKEYYWEELETELKGRTPLCKWRISGFSNIQPMYGFVVKKPSSCEWTSKSKKWIAYVVSFELGTGKIENCHNSDAFYTRKSAETYLKELNGQITKYNDYGW